MKDDLQLMLDDLQPDIEMKCNEIKQKKREKRLQVFFVLGILLFLFVPSILIILNMSLIYMFILVLFVIALSLFLWLPQILKNDKGIVVYE